ncbi:NAD(P)-binding protein [Entophlyctis helioformis]|nr:NAD(P)-binding protein [Entophlyctis helioformis]
MGLGAKHVFITGASGGVGLATAEAFVKRGSLVTLHFNSNAAAAQTLHAQFPSQTRLARAAVTSESDVDSAVREACASAFGPVEILVVCHGIWPAADVGVKDMPLDRWRNTMAVNLDGTFLFVRAFLRGIEAAGTAALEAPSIVLWGECGAGVAGMDALGAHWPADTHTHIHECGRSTAGKFGEAWHADYSATKTAMMYGLALSLKNEIVKVHPRARVNTVSPGWIRTPMAQRAMQDPSLLFQALASTPLKKVSEPADVAQAIVFLSDAEQSGNITGVSLDLNGGMEGRLLNRPGDFGAKL